MPKAQKPASLSLARLPGLPRSADLVIEGGRRPLGMFVREGKQAIQPQAVLWLDAQSLALRATDVVNPQASPDGGITEALEALALACVDPVATPGPAPLTSPQPRARGKRSARGPAPEPALPARIRVNDAALADAVRVVFAPLGVAVEHVDPLPSFDASFASLAGFLGADEAAEPPEPFTWDVDTSLLPALFKAAAGLWRRAPWDYMPDTPPVSVTLGEHGPEPGRETLYASILGGAGLVLGAAFYYSLEDLRQARRQGTALQVHDEDIDDTITLLRQMGVPVDQMPPDLLHEAVGTIMEQSGLDGGPALDMEGLQNSLVVFFTPEEENDPTYGEWLAEHNLKAPARAGVPSFIRTAPGDEPRPPNTREVTALTLALEALNEFFSQHRRQLEVVALPGSVLTHQAQVGSGPDRVAVALAFPPPDYDWAAEAEEAAWEEPEQAATEAGARTVYRFLVTLDWEPEVWRRIEVRGDQTLHDLHEAIQEAFEWDDDHLYAFYLSGKPWDTETEYERPGSRGRSAARYRLEHLPLRRGKKLLYIFDFGDELRHTIRLEAIVRDGVAPGVEYPRITERHGGPVPQYPYAEDDDWEGEEDDEGE
jgi:hypothetical protein